MSGYQGLRVEAQVLIEEEQTPFLCMHFDKTSEKIFILADSESLQKLRKVEALVEIENILKSTFEESKKLTMFDQKAEVERPSCQRAGLAMLSSLSISSLGRRIYKGALRTKPLQMWIMKDSTS